jgi:hypothetical protein
MHAGEYMLAIIGSEVKTRSLLVSPSAAAAIRSQFGFCAPCARLARYYLLFPGRKDLPGVLSAIWDPWPWLGLDPKA